MRIRTGLRSSLHFSFEQPDWYGVISQELAQVVEALPIWSLFGFIEAPDTPSEPLTPASFDRIVRNPKNQGWELSALQGPAGQLGGRGDVSFECTVHDDWLILRVTLLDAAFQRFASSTETILAPFLGAFGRPLLLSVSGARPWFDPDLPWQKLRPRPPATYLAYENVVDVFDSRLPSAWADREGGPVAERILAAPVPVGVRKVERDGKVLFFWTDALTDPDALAAARMRHERWLAELVRPGSTDRRLEMSSQDEAPPLTSSIEGRAAGRDREGGRQPPRRRRVVTETDSGRSGPFPGDEPRVDW